MAEPALQAGAQPGRAICPLCSSPAAAPVRVAAWVEGAPPYVQCLRCGLVFHAMPVPEPDRRPLSREGYLQGTTWKLPTNRIRLAWLLRHVSVPRGRAVDIGTKDGSAVKVLSDMGWQAVGYDPDSRFHGYAAERHGIEIRPAWFTAAAVGPGSLDLVTAFHVIEHIRDPIPWLSEIRDALQPGGYLHIETPNLRYVQSRQLRPGHVVLYTAHTLRQVLEAAGFRVVLVSEFAPGGSRTYDQLSAIARWDGARRKDFSVSRLDRDAHRYLWRPVPDSASTNPVIHLYRRVRWRVRAALRRAGHHVRA